MITLGLVIATLFIFEIVVAIIICFYQLYKEDVEWYIHTKKQKYWR
jgi:hypothetical protein